MTQAELRTFVTRERRRLVGYVRSLVRDAAELDAEDLVQDVLLRMLERTDLTVPLENLGAYVYRALKNRVIDQLRARRPTVSLDSEPAGAGLSEALADIAPTAFHALQTERGRAQLFEALDTLSDMERRVLLAHEFDGIPFQEIADSTGVRLNTLLSHKHRAMNKLKQHFATLRQMDGGSS